MMFISELIQYNVNKILTGIKDVFVAQFVLHKYSLNTLFDLLDYSKNIRVLESFQLILFYELGCGIWLK